MGTRSGWVPLSREKSTLVLAAMVAAEASQNPPAVQQRFAGRRVEVPAVLQRWSRYRQAAL